MISQSDALSATTRVAGASSVISRPVMSVTVTPAASGASVAAGASVASGACVASGAAAGAQAVRASSSAASSAARVLFRCFIVCQSSLLFRFF